MMPHVLCPFRQVAARLQKEVEDLVLEVFERLPQTVDGFRDGDIAGSGMEVSRYVPQQLKRVTCRGLWIRAQFTGLLHVPLVKVSFQTK